MVSEKAYNSFFLGTYQSGDRLGYFSGFGINTLRSGWRNPVQDFTSDTDVVTDRFGSAHPYSMNALFADGSVRQIRYEVPENRQVLPVWSPLLVPFKITALPSPPNPPNSMALTLMQRLCHRSDTGTVQLNELE